MREMRVVIEPDEGSYPLTFWEAVAKAVEDGEDIQCSPVSDSGTAPHMLYTVFGWRPDVRRMEAFFDDGRVMMRLPVTNISQHMTVAGWRTVSREERE